MTALKVGSAGSEPLRAQAPTPSRPSGATKEKEAKKTRGAAAEAGQLSKALWETIDIVTLSSRNRGIAHESKSVLMGARSDGKPPREQSCQSPAGVETDPYVLSPRPYALRPSGDFP